MTQEQKDSVIDALVGFIVRVSKGKTTSEKEVEVLPEVVSRLCAFSSDDCYKIGF